MHFRNLLLKKSAATLMVLHFIIYVGQQVIHQSYRT